jgi:hypothetical protein
MEMEDDPMGKTDELLAINQKRGAELKTILTSEQIKQLETIREEQIARLESILSHLKENDF